MKKLILALAMVLMASIVCASPIAVQLVGVSPGQPIDVEIAGFYDGEVLAGNYDLLVNGIPYAAYCVDEWAWASTLPKSYDLEPLPDNLKDAAWVMEQNLDPVISQVAIWELISSDAGDLSSGNFSVQSWYPGLTQTQALVTQVLGLNLSGFDTLNFEFLHSATYQDYIVQTTAVPEPETMLLFGSGLIGLAGLGRRVRKQERLRPASKPEGEGEMNIREIAGDYLLKNNFDGLFNDDIDCGCELDDLMPCSDYPVPECKPGYRQVCDCGSHDFHIGEKQGGK